MRKLVFYHLVFYLEKYEFCEVKVAIYKTLPNSWLSQIAVMNIEYLPTPRFQEAL